MNKWEVYEWKKSSTPLDSDWLVRELATDGTLIDVIINCGFGEPAEDLARRIAKLPELEAIVGEVLTTLDGVLIVPGRDVWFFVDGETVDGVVLTVKWGDDFRECHVRDSYGDEHWLDPDDCYSTREAVEAAGKEVDDV